MIVVSRAHGNSQVECWEIFPDALVQVSLLACEMHDAHWTLDTHLLCDWNCVIRNPGLLPCGGRLADSSDSLLLLFLRRLPASTQTQIACFRRNTNKHFKDPPASRMYAPLSHRIHSGRVPTVSAVNEQHSNLDWSGLS